MVIIIVILSASVLFLLALFMAVVLGWANEALHVEVDPRILSVDEALPGVNCGGCGYIGCSEYAEAVVNDGVAVDLCPVGGSSCAAAIAAIMGMEHEESCPEMPIVHLRAVELCLVRYLPAQSMKMNDRSNCHRSKTKTPTIIDATDSHAST